jgi:hypothetical protein
MLKKITACKNYSEEGAMENKFCDICLYKLPEKYQRSYKVNPPTLVGHLSF